MTQENRNEMFHRPYPAQPDEKEWRFVKELRNAPVHRVIRWQRRMRKDGEISLGEGVRLAFEFPDPADRLETAYADFRKFLDAGGIGQSGNYIVRTERVPTDLFETYRVTVDKTCCLIQAADTEGIRRGLVWVEDEILRSGGPFLKEGRVARTPVIRTRISRCFYSPIHRPPKNRDELADDENYYPDEYLNRLAHDGTNGIWIYTRWRELIPSRIIPEYGKDSARRLEKLRRTVKQCGRFGIRVYSFCIEPAGFAADDPVLAAHPELGGNRMGTSVFFCISSEKGKAYVEEAARTLFTEVPDLGGIINISVGENQTHCHSWSLDDSYPNNCPRCSKRAPEDVLADTLAAMEKGMHSVAPEAELISWPYDQLHKWGTDAMIKAAGKVPKGVILQHNFETGGKQKQLGRWHTAWDYWLSYIGPSGVFRKCAQAAIGRGGRVFAKLQVGNSHEIADVPCLSVPGNLYDKYKRMHRLGVSGAMQCWYFGNYPSLMTKAAGELSFAPFPETKAAFLNSLARREWGNKAAKVVKAWKLFEKGYRNYPLNNIFGYYGPMQDGPVVPLHLKPVDKGLAPTWQIGFPPSGDRIGECVTYSHALDEVLFLCKTMAENWNGGAAILAGLKAFFRNNSERLLDIGLAEAVGIQLASGYHMLKFYALREKLFAAKHDDKLALFEEMRSIVNEEMKADRQLLELARVDSRLGFHSEAEGYKYFPAAIQWRMKQLELLLNRDFPAVEKTIHKGEPLFPEYTGEKPEGKTYRCARLESGSFKNEFPPPDCWVNVAAEKMPFRELWASAESRQLDQAEPAGMNTAWQAVWDKQTLFIRVECGDPNTASLAAPNNDGEPMTASFNDLVDIWLEPRRLWPPMYFLVNAKGARYQDKIGSEAKKYGWQAKVEKNRGGWRVVLRIPFNVMDIGEPEFPPLLRLNVSRRKPDVPRRLIYTWRWKETHGLPGRLYWGVFNPADLGWLLF